MIHERPGNYYVLNERKETLAIFREGNSAIKWARENEPERFTWYVEPSGVVAQRIAAAITDAPVGTANGDRWPLALDTPRTPGQLWERLAERGRARRPRVECTSLTNGSWQVGVTGARGDAHAALWARDAVRRRTAESLSIRLDHRDSRDGELTMWFKISEVQR